MSTVAHSGSLAWQPPKLPVWRFTVDEYLRLMEAGIFSEPEKVELLEGLMVPKMTRNARHDLALELADEVIRPLLPADWRLRVQSALVTPDSVPEPDIAAVRGHALRFQIAGRAGFGGGDGEFPVSRHTGALAEYQDVPDLGTDIDRPGR